MVFSGRPRGYPGRPLRQLQAPTHFQPSATPAQPPLPSLPAAPEGLLHSLRPLEEVHQLVFLLALMQAPLLESVQSAKDIADENVGARMYYGLQRTAALLRLF